MPARLGTTEANPMRNFLLLVMPAQAGIQVFGLMGSRPRGHDGHRPDQEFPKTIIEQD
jgi:hypothetical protein